MSKIKYLKIILLIGLLSYSALAEERTAFSIGPMVHFNFGQNKMLVSFALEASLWTFDPFPASIDLGLELDRTSLRIYSEFQTGAIITGISVGGVLEIKNDNLYAGLQSSVWGNYYGGADLRYRRINGADYFCPGIYAKLPVILSGSFI